MHSIRQPADAQGITDPALMALIQQRLPLLDLAPIIIVEEADSEADIIRATGISPLVNLVDGERYPSPLFTPSWEIIEQHHGWTELIYVTGDDGSGTIMLVADSNKALSGLLRDHG